MSEQDMQRQFKLHLPGLLTVLSENLYSTKKVAVRELLQNAHDGITRRKVQAKEPFYQPKVTIEIDVPRSRLIISDNGYGLTMPEIEEYLATIGRSYTAEFREQLNMVGSDQALNLIGQFGLGFLSAFLLATEIEVTTRSFNSEEAFLFHCTNNGTYTVKPAQRDEAGTTVELVVKPDSSFLLSEGTLTRTVRQYANFLPIPIRMKGDPIPVNQITPPWESADPKAAALEYIRQEFDIEQPLAVIPLHDIQVDLGHDEMTVPLQGFLFIPPGSVVSLREYGDVTVYIRRMFITERYSKLLPPWARFVHGVIDCPELAPTASREDLHEDNTLRFVQQSIEKQLLEALQDIIKNDPTTWGKIVYGHNDIIVGWALKDNTFFNHIAEHVRFRTSRGQLTLGEYLKLTDNTLYYAKQEIGSLQEKLLAEAQDVPVIDGSWAFVPAFLNKYAATKDGTTLIQVDGESSEFMHSVETQPYEALLRYYQKRKIRVQVTSFKPASMPAVMKYPKDTEFIQETRSALDAGELPEAFAEMVSNYIDRLNPGDLSGTLYLNASCPLIDQLSQMPPDDADKREALLAVIYQFARLFAGRTLTAVDARDAYQEVIQMLGNLVK